MQSLAPLARIGHQPVNAVFDLRHNGIIRTNFHCCINRISFHVSPSTTKAFLHSVMRPNRSHVGSVVSCVDIIRQGRGSLVTTIEIYKIIALNCLVNAFVLSVREIHVFV